MLPFVPRNDTFMSSVDDHGADALLSAGLDRRYPAGDTLFHQGDPSRHVIVIRDGWVKITAVTRRGWEALLAVRGAGDIVGEASAIDAELRSATVRTLTNVEATVIPSEAFLETLRTNPLLTTQLLSYINGRLRESDQRRSQFGSMSGNERLISLLDELTEQYGQFSREGIVIGIPLSQRELAAAVGVSRQVAAQTLRTLRERGIIRTRRQRIVIVERDLLTALSGSV